MTPSLGIPIKYLQDGFLVDFPIKFYDSEEANNIY
jgi:hypothetical protein